MSSLHRLVLAPRAALNTLLTLSDFKIPNKRAGVTPELRQGFSRSAHTPSRALISATIASGAIEISTTIASRSSGSSKVSN